MFNSLRSDFQSRYGVVFAPLPLGTGRDGEVYATNNNTAVKFFTLRESYAREAQAYRVLTRLKIEEIAGHTVPRFVRADDELMAIEMGVVWPPFLLDFASAYPANSAPEFSEEVMEQWRAEKIEQFGDRWSDVEVILSQFRRQTGFVLLDVNPGNIRFAAEGESDSQ
jgi:hypothetical protein